MECENLRTVLQTDFTRVANKGNLFQDGSSIYAKEIRKGTFLLINILEDNNNYPIQAMIANFDNLESIGKVKPIQLLFHLKINNNSDLQYLKTYLSTAV